MGFKHDDMKTVSTLKQSSRKRGAGYTRSNNNYVSYSPGDLQTGTGRTHPRLHGMANSPVAGVLLLGLQESSKKKLLAPL
jgi:hypothetical protein